jgi:hypothetical protein
MQPQLTIDLNMGYYSMALDVEADALSEISLPWESHFWIWP